jgi:hypothetical protein
MSGTYYVRIGKPILLVVNMALVLEIRVIMLFNSIPFHYEET